MCGCNDDWILLNFVNICHLIIGLFDDFWLTFSAIMVICLKCISNIFMNSSKYQMNGHFMHQIFIVLNKSRWQFYETLSLNESKWKYLNTWMLSTDPNDTTKSFSLFFPFDELLTNMWSNRSFDRYFQKKLAWCLINDHRTDEFWL